jgi:serine/threonine-protein phosphatase 2A regulatory subunit B'
VYETERHNGSGELLEILGSIINGFALPLKKEHIFFMKHALLPLHKPKCVALYHQQLSYCVTQFVEKDPATGVFIINGLVKYWPWASTSKQVLFLNELEEVMELITDSVFQTVIDPLILTISQCVSSQHFQVAERALFLWNNEHLVQNGCLSKKLSPMVLPRIYGALYKNAQFGMESAGEQIAEDIDEPHWNTTVEGLTQNVLKLYMDYDISLFDEVQRHYINDEQERRAQAKRNSQAWQALENSASKK